MIRTGIGSGQVRSGQVRSGQVRGSYWASGFNPYPYPISMSILQRLWVFFSYFFLSFGIFFGVLFSYSDAMPMPMRFHLGTLYIYIYNLHYITWLGLHVVLFLVCWFGCWLVGFKERMGKDGKGKERKGWERKGRQGDE